MQSITFFANPYHVYHLPAKCMLPSLHESISGTSITRKDALRRRVSPGRDNHAWLIGFAQFLRILDTPM